MAKSKVAIAAAVIVTIIIIAFSVYAAQTYPKTIVTIPISFTAGVDATNTQLNQPALNSKVQVQVSVQNGATLWRARISNGDQVIWEHSAAQGEQTSYNSGWLDLPSGTYTFTFGTIGGGSLEATVTVSAKGGFW